MIRFYYFNIKMKVYILVSWDGQTVFDPDVHLLDARYFNNVNIEGIFESKENAKNKIIIIEQKQYNDMDKGDMILLIEEDDRFGDCENDFVPWSEVHNLLLNQHDIVNGLYIIKFLKEQLNNYNLNYNYILLIK